MAVGLDFESGTIRLLVKDDGAGFDVSDGRSREASGSFGLPGMVERAHLIGARLTIHSGPVPEPPSTSGYRQRISFDRMVTTAIGTVMSL